MVEQIQNTQQPVSQNPVQSAPVQGIVKKSAPVGVKIISILYYIGAAVGLIFGLSLMFGGGALSTLLGGLGILFGSLFIILGIILIGFAVLSFFIGRGLWKAQKWARIVAIIFGILGFLGGVFSLVGGSIGAGIVNILIEGFIIGYLLFSLEVKQFFS